MIGMIGIHVSCPQGILIYYDRNNIILNCTDYFNQRTIKPTVSVWIAKSLKWEVLIYDLAAMEDYRVIWMMRRTEGGFQSLYLGMELVAYDLTFHHYARNTQVALIR